MSWVDEVFETLSNGGPRTVSLDEIGEAIGLRFAEPSRIEELFSRLEARGFTIEASATPDLRARLSEVLVTARSLRGSGAPAGVAEIAGALGWSVRETRSVLLYAEVLARGTRAPG